MRAGDHSFKASAAPRTPSAGPRVLLTSAGNGPSNNLARSLRANAEPIFLVGCHDDQFVLKCSPAERNYVLPPSRHRHWAKALRYIVEKEAVQLIIPTTDEDVAALSRVRKLFRSKLFLPSASVIETCQDKHRLITLLQRRGVDAPATCEIQSLQDIPAIFRKLGPGRPLWCRARTGAGALGALPVQTPAQARSWIRYWGEMRGLPASSFVLSEYLPGRDFGCQSLWRNGELILIKTYERLSYLGTGNRPAEVSSVAALAKTVVEPGVAAACEKAIRLLDPRISGVFSADLKENARGAPCVTEINPGRFSSATNIFDLVGKHNMAASFVRAACGERFDLRGANDAVEGWYMLRDLDRPPHIFHTSEFFDNIDDAWQALGSRPVAQQHSAREDQPWRT